MQFDLRTMAEHMGGVAWGVVIVLAIMSIYSIGVMIERYWTYTPGHQAVPQVRARGRPLPEAGQDQGGDRRLPRRQREALAPGQGAAWSACRNGSTSRRSAKPSATRRPPSTRPSAPSSARRPSTWPTSSAASRGLATIGSTAPFVGLFGTTFGIINAFSGMALTGSGGIAAISAGIAEALITTAFGLFVAVPAVWAYNYFARQGRGLQRRDGQLQLRAARLLHQEGRLAASPRAGRGLRPPPRGASPCR